MGQVLIFIIIILSFASPNLTAGRLENGKASFEAKSSHKS